jgi:uncharacterized membrane protein YbhN (UPF0104 family)
LRNIIRTVVVIGLAVGLLAVFLRNADLGKVWASVTAARPDFLLLSLAVTCGTFVVRAERWQYLLGPLGKTRFSTVFRTTVIGFASSAVLPARAGEVIRPYLLARREGLKATAAFATIILPARIAAMIARFAQTFAEGFAVVRSPGRLVAAMAWSIVLWIAIASGIWAVSVAFGIAMPFTGAWLMLGPLVVGVAVPTPGGVGGFHEAYRFGATAFFGADNDTAVGAAIVLHAISVGPVILVGLLFIVQDGLKLGGMARGELGMDEGATK